MASVLADASDASMNRPEGTVVKEQPAEPTSGADGAVQGGPINACGKQ
jgi:hypothetical protein